MRILYVEDDVRDAAQARRYLAQALPDAVLETVETLAAASERLSTAAEYDVLLLDLSLPDGSGLDLLAQVREEDRSLATIVLTGTGREEMAVAALKAGADDYVIKRDDYLSRLPAILSDALQRRHTVASRSQPLRVLYAEHNAADIDLTRRHLAHHAPHIRLDVVYGVSEMLARLPQTAGEAIAYDVLLIDYRLPGLNALEALKVIRQERQLSVPVVLVTGQGSEEVAVNALRLGATDYLVKHSGYLFELPAALENAFHYSRLEREKAALRESEARFRRLAENARDLIVRFDTELRHLYVNDAMVELTGIPQEQFLGRTNEELGMPPDLVAFWREELQQVIDTGMPRTISFEFMGADGAARYFEASVTPERDADGQLVSLLSVVRDITERKQAEEELARRERHYRLLFASNPQPMWVYDLQTLAFLAVNDAAIERYGYAEEEFLAMTIEDIRPPEDVRRLREDLAGRRPALQHSGEWRHRLRDGKIIDVEIASHALTFSGRPAALVTAFDVTERKRIAAELEAQAQRLQQILDTVPDGVALLDGEGQVTLANPAGETVLQRLAGVQVGERVTTIGGLSLSQLLQGPKEGQRHTVAYDEGHFELLARPIVSAAAGGDWVLLLRDVTAEHEREEYLQAQQRLATVGQLAAGIAHDFNNVMAVILLYTQMLQNMSDLPAEAEQPLATIVGQAQHAAGLIAQILDFSRQSVMERTSVDLLSLLREFVRLLRSTLPESIRIELSADDGDAVVLADPTRLQQALMNAAMNARDAMPDGGRLSFTLSTVTIGSNQPLPLPDLEPGDWIRITISDTGTGIQPENLPHVFEPFFTTKVPGKGTGLGLAQLYGIVKQHGGSVGVDSELDRGATITIYLPPFVAQSAEVPALTSLPGAPGGSETILLVEDNSTLRDSLADVLSGLGYRVLEAEDGVEALAVLDSKGDAIDVLLSDLVMPKTGGLELYRDVQKRFPELPVLFMTGYPLGEREVELAGRPWILKPFNVNQIGHKLRSLLDD